MAQQTYIDRIAGRFQRIVALIVSTGASDANKIVQTNSTGVLDQSLMPPGVGPDTFTANAGENLLANDLCYVTSAGTIMKASAATSGFDAQGYVPVAASSGTPATLYFDGEMTGMSGLTAGTRYYLSDTTAGGITATPVSGVGKKDQYVGRALSATVFSFEADDAVVL